jgi:hypothetical protein
MYPRIKSVKAQDDYKILLTFTNDEVKIFDMKPYINKGFFKQLQKRSYFNTVKPFMDSIQWKNGQDLCPDTLYLDSQSLTSQRN